MANQSRLVGRRIIVTGAAGGMGQAIVALLRAEGARVAMFDRFVQMGQPKEFLENDGQIFGVDCDVADETNVASAVKLAADRFGGIDGIVNAAGIFRRGTVENGDTAIWRQVLDVNLLGPMFVCKSAIPLIREAGGGTIVNIASVAAIKPSPTSAAYGASKGGLVAFGKSLAQEVAPLIRVNTICPGAIDTPMIVEDQRRAPNPGGPPVLPSALRRIGTPGEIASAVVFLSCDESSFFVGSTLVADGGWAWF